LGSGYQYRCMVSVGSNTMKSALLTVAAIAPVALAGCTSQSTLLQDSHGRQMACNNSGAGLIFVITATMAHDNCVQTLEKAGYHIVSENGSAN
jgi:hypothetical protein